MGIFGALLILSVGMIIIENSFPRITGFATSQSTISNVTISKYFSIDMSDNLSDGIQFGTVDTIPVIDHNSTWNNITSNATGMFLNVSTDSNTNVDFCVQANTDLTDPSNSATIGLGNESYANDTTTNYTLPALASQVSLTTSYVKSGYNITVGGINYYRFWLDIPAATTSGTYNNSVDFKGVQVNTSC